MVGWQQGGAVARASNHCDAHHVEEIIDGGPRGGGPLDLPLLLRLAVGPEVLPRAAEDGQDEVPGEETEADVGGLEQLRTGASVGT